MHYEQEIQSRLKESIVDLDIEGVEKACKDAMAMKMPYKVIMEGMAMGMDVVGKKFEAGEYYLAELVMAGETAKKVMEILEPHMRTGEVKTIGKVVFGTVKGDIHDIGKNIVVMLLKAALFNVIDLGTDVPSYKFVDAVIREKSDILAMSAMLNMTMFEMETVIRDIEQAGLRESIRIIVGGTPINASYAKKIGADAAAKDAFEGVKICKSWVGLS